MQSAILARKRKNTVPVVSLTWVRHFLTVKLQRLLQPGRKEYKFLHFSCVYAESICFSFSGSTIATRFTNCDTPMTTERNHDILSSVYTSVILRIMHLNNSFNDEVPDLHRPIAVILALEIRLNL